HPDAIEAGLAHLLQATIVPAIGVHVDEAAVGARPDQADGLGQRPRAVERIALASLPERDHRAAAHQMAHGHIRDLLGRRRKVKADLWRGHGTILFGDAPDALRRAAWRDGDGALPTAV